MMSPASSPDLAALAGFHDYITAELLQRQRRYSQASRHYRAALAQGRDWVYLRGAGINALQRAKKIAAVGFFSDALALRPQDPQPFRSRHAGRSALARNRFGGTADGG